MPNDGATEHFERSLPEHRRPGADLSASIWADSATGGFLIDLARRERRGSESISPDFLVMVPIPALGDFSAGLLALATTTSEYRPSVERQDLTVGHLRDTGSRYTSPDARGTGSNHVDVDHLGIVHALGYVDAHGVRGSITGAQLAELLGGNAIAGWSAAREENSVTQITAPDGRTTYYIDGRGRLIPDRGSVRVDSPRSIVVVDLGNGASYDSATTGGAIRSARVDAEGRLIQIDIRRGSEMFTINRSLWSHVSSGQRLDLGDGWSVERGNFGGTIPPDSIRIFHRDGAGYLVSPDGVLLRVFSPAGPGGVETLNTERRLTARTESINIGVLGDSGTRYLTQDRRGMGTNAIDIDHLGIVRGVAFVDVSGLRRTLNMARLDDISSDGTMHNLPGGWRASRTGSGANTVTILVAPDGGTTYHLDSAGRILPGRGSLAVAAPPGMARVALGDGAHRHESVMEDGKIASASVTGDGMVSRIIVRGGNSTDTYERAQLELAASSNGILGNGWTVRRVNDREISEEVPLGSLMMTHADGTTFIIGPNGRYLSGLSSRAWRRLTQRR